MLFSGIIRRIRLTTVALIAAAGAAANTGIEANIRAVPKPPHAAAEVVKLYDVVFDFVDGTGALMLNGRLDPGDVIGLLTTTAADAEVSVVRDPGAAAAAPPAIGTNDYDAGRITIRQPFDGLVADKEVRMIGQIVYPNPIPANASFVAIAHGNHTPRQRPDGGSSSIRTSVLTDIPPIYSARLTDDRQSIGMVGGNVHRRFADFVTDADTSTESFFKTIRVDPCLFLTHEPALDLTRIAAIRIEFAPSARGRVGFDDLDLTSR